MPAPPAPSAPSAGRRARRAAAVGALAIVSAAAAVPSAGAAQRYESRPDIAPTEITVTQAAQNTAPGLVFTAPKNGGTVRGAMIFDESAGLVWWRPAAKGKSVIDFRRQTYQGKPVLTFWEGRGLRGYGYGETVILDDRYHEIARVSPGGRKEADFHEFTLTPRGTALLISYRPVRQDTRSVKGGAKNDLVMQNLIQEVDVATNKVVWEWSSTDAVSPSESYLPLPRDPKVAYDFVHANSATLDADGDVLVSARHTSTIYKIDRETKKIVWKLGGKRSTYRFGKGARFGWQHDAQRQPDGTISLFDNVTPDANAKGVESRGLLLRLDDEAGTATRERQWTNPKPQVNNTQGNLQALPNGNWFVGWGGTGDNVSEFSRDGKQLFEAKYGNPLVESYRAYRSTWNAQPTVPPRAVARRSGRSTAVRVSWNGATTVMSWRVLGGASASALQPRQTLSRRGFETLLRYGAQDKVVVVEALDAGGKVLSRTSPVAVGDKY